MCLRNAVNTTGLRTRCQDGQGHIAKSCVDHQALQLDVMAQLILSDIYFVVS